MKEQNYTSLQDHLVSAFPGSYANSRTVLSPEEGVQIGLAARSQKLVSAASLLGVLQQMNAALGGQERTIEDFEIVEIPDTDRKYIHQVIQGFYERQGLEYRGLDGIGEIFSAANVELWVNATHVKVPAIIRDKMPDKLLVTVKSYTKREDLA